MWCLSCLLNTTTGLNFRLRHCVTSVIVKGGRMTQSNIFTMSRVISASLFCVLLSASATASESPAPVGRTVDLGGHRLHVNCSGKGSPTVVIENGLGDFSFDWVLVQRQVEKFTRVCTYDRAGYAWSDPGPKPRTFAQINLELRDALAKLGEKGPFVLVGHSYGGPEVVNLQKQYSNNTAGMVLVESAHERMRGGVGGKRR